MQSIGQCFSLIYEVVTLQHRATELRTGLSVCHQVDPLVVQEHLPVLPSLTAGCIGLRTDTDTWLGSYEHATSLANEVLSSIQVITCLQLQPKEASTTHKPSWQGLKWYCFLQERNLKHPNGGPEASRISAAARRKLATLGTTLDNLADLLESPECASV